jgi:hypothetical protein
MGKKTDKFMSDLIKAGDDCEDLLTQLVHVHEEMLANNAEWDKNVSNPNSPAFKKVQTDREQIFDRGKPLCDKLQAALNNLSPVLSAFRTYIDKKAKSKNPFKSKKSLPAAQDTIKVYTEFHKNVTKALGEIRSESFRGS